MWELCVTGVASTIVGVIGKGALSKWLERRARTRAADASSLISEVRAHGETKAKVAALEQRVVELENHDYEREDRHKEEREEWARERDALAARIAILETLLTQ